MQNLRPLLEHDPEVHAAIAAETTRQQNALEMIPSENYVSPAVLSTIGTVLTNKYSEGYPGRRYFGGNEHIDTLEELARNRARRLFGADHANVQPYSGSSANQAVYFALIEPGDTVMGLSLPDGGHLTHGWKVSFSGRFYRAVQYGVDPTTGLLDYDQIARLAREHRPRLIWAGFSAYPRLVDFDKFAQIARDVGARFAADIAHISGLVLAGLHPDPVPCADAVTMTTHKMLRGPRGAMILCKEEHATAVDRAVFPGLQGGPRNQSTAGIAVCLHEAGTPAYEAYCKQVVDNARTLAEELIRRGFDVVTGGTDNHIVLIDLTAQRVSGRAAQNALDRAHIAANANTIPGDTRPAYDPSGVRLGTTAATTRGLKEDEMRHVGRWFADVINNLDDETTIERVRNEVVALCERFPLWY